MAAAPDKINNNQVQGLLEEIGEKLSRGRNTKVFNLLYKADKEVDVNAFHDSCDSKGPTVTLLHGKHNTLFGGYTSKHWLSTDKHVTKRDTEAFLFYRNSDQSGQCVYMPVKEEKAEKAITCHATFGPTFGGSSKQKYDLQVFKHAPKNQSRHTGKYIVLNGVLEPGKSYEVSNPNETKNEINSGKLEVTCVEVFQVIEDELTHNWREKPKDFETMKQELIAMVPDPRLDVKQYNILLVGAVGSGKSSFCNTLGTVFSEDVTRFAVVGTAAESLTKRKKEYDLATKDGKILKIRIIDIRGIDNERGLKNEFRYILDGRLPSGYQFSENDEPIREDQLIEAWLNEEIHLVCFVTCFTQFDLSSDSLKKHFEFVKETVADKGLQSAVVVTKMDEICSGIGEDFDHIDKCAKAQKCTVNAAAFFGIPQNHIFPVVNYTKEEKTNKGIDRLALQALYKMYLLVDAYFKNSEELQKKQGNWESRDRTICPRARVGEERKIQMLTTRRMKLTKELTKRNEKQLRILCFGPSRSGKSSFIDSVLSTFRREIRSDATGGNTDTSSATTMFQLYQIKYENDARGTERSNVYLVDMPGIQEEGGVQLNDVKLIVKGHVANKRKIQNGAHKYSKKFKTKSQPKHRIHCVCFVFDLYTVENLPSSTLSKCCEFKTWLTGKGIPFVVVMTNCDRVSEVVKQNPTRVFEDKRISECKDKLVMLFKVKESMIYPVQNYVDETTTVSDIEDLLLNVIGKVLSHGYEHLDDLEKKKETGEESDENGSEKLQDESKSKHVMGEVLSIGYEHLECIEGNQETDEASDETGSEFLFVGDRLTNIAERFTNNAETETLVFHTVDTIEKSNIKTADKVTSEREGPFCLETLKSIDEICTTTTENYIPVSQAVATIEKSKKQTGEYQETHEREWPEECLKRHKTKNLYMLAEHKKMIKRLLPTKILNEAERLRPESLSKTVDNSEKTKLLPDPNDSEYIQKKLLDSCKVLEQFSTEMFEEISKSLENARTEKRELHEKDLGQTEVKATCLQDSTPKMKIEKYRHGSASATIQFFNVQAGITMDTIKENLRTCLDDRLENVHFEDCNSPEDILENHLLIIPCIIATRIGEDASRAIKNIPNPGKTVLVMIHNSEEYALQEQKSSLILNNKKYKNFCGIFDLAFTKDKGFYSCRMNSENFDNLCKLCKETIGIRL